MSKTLALGPALRPFETPMQSVLIVIHILIVVSLIVVVLLQRSEGGALGTGGGTGSFMTGRGQANALSRATAILGALFFATALLMSILSSWSRAPIRFSKEGPRSGRPDRSHAVSPGNILDQLKQLGGQSGAPQRPRRLRPPLPRRSRRAPQALRTEPKRSAGGPLALPVFRDERRVRHKAARDVRSRRRHRALSGIRSAMQGA